MKKITILMLLLTLQTFIFADTLYLNDGNSIIGEILKTTDSSVSILTKTGTLNFDKSEINTIDQDIYEQPQRIDQDVTIITREVYKYDPDLRTHRRMFGLSLSFFISGNIVLFGTLAFMTPNVIQYYTAKVLYTITTERYDTINEKIVYDYEYKYIDEDKSLLLAASYASMLATGIGLTVIAIPFFIKSFKYLENFKKRHNFSLGAGFDGKKVAFGFQFSL